MDSTGTTVHFQLDSQAPLIEEASLALIMYKY